MKNPFILGVIPESYPFCDREKELAELERYALDGTNIVLHSPRRYGKTSLVHRVQASLAKQNVTTVYVDFYGVTDVNDLASRVARQVYLEIHKRQNLLKKAFRYMKAFRPIFRPSASGDNIEVSVERISTSISGIDLLTQTMEDIGAIIKNNTTPVNIVFDEFQEITGINDSRVEGIMRRYIQEQQASYFFVGSRRRILLEMFGKKRPFFQSAIKYELNSLPLDELTNYISAQFKSCGKDAQEISPVIAKLSNGHAFYAQKISLFTYNCSGIVVTEDDVLQAQRMLLNEETSYFEAILQGLSSKQISLLRGIATDTQEKVLTAAFLSKWDISLGGAQKALKKLSDLDLIEKGKPGYWQVVDKFFALWLIKNAEGAGPN